MIRMIILYTFIFSSFSSHVTCVQEWSCEKCNTMFCLREITIITRRFVGVYIPIAVKNVEMCTRARKACGYKRKQHADDVCHFTFFV